MRRILLIIPLIVAALCGPSSARLIVVKQHDNSTGPCNQPSSGPLECTILSALQLAPPIPAEIDTIAISRGGDTAHMVWLFQSLVDVNKPVTLIDSSYLATGIVRYRLEGIGLRFNASPVRIAGFSFTRTGSNLSSVSLFGVGPDDISNNLFNLAPGDSAMGGNYSIYGILVGAKNVKTRIANNKFGIFGTAFSAGRAVTVYGDSTLIQNNRFGMTQAGAAVLFNASAVDVSSYTASGSPDTLYAPIGGTVTGNRIATCSEMSGGIALGGSTGEGGTRGWLIANNSFGASLADSTKVLAGCTPSLDETRSAIVLSSTSTSGNLLTGNTVRDNNIWVAPNGIVLRGPATTGNTVWRNRVGSPGETVATSIISYNGIFIHGGAVANIVDSNTIGGSATGIRLAWNTGYGNALDNLIRANLIGAVATPTSPTNDTGISLGYTSSGNLFENNVIAGNRHHGIVFSSSFLQPNRVEHNRIGVTNGGVERPNGGSSIRSVVGGGRQAIRGNIIGPSTGWGVEIVTSSSRATVLDSNRFVGKQDSGAVLAQGSDSVRILDNRFDSCAVACVQLRGSKIGLIARNWFGGQNPAVIARAHPTQSWLVTSALLDSNVLPAIAVPIDLIGTPGYTPNDPLDADDGPMGLLNYPALQSATAAADSVVLTYNLDLAVTTTAPRIQVYAKLPDSTTLRPLGSWTATTGNGRRLAFVSPIPLPSGTLLRAGLTDAAGNSSELDSGRTLSGGTAITFENLPRIGETAPRWTNGNLFVNLTERTRIQWETRSLTGQVRSRGTVLLDAGLHRIPVSASPEPTLLRVTLHGSTFSMRLPAHLIPLGSP